MYKNDKRIVMTLDAGGTNFVFSAMKGAEEIVYPITLPTESSNIDKCLKLIILGFNKVKQLLTEKPVAISFAFPGPADYKSGIIGDLQNLPCFRGGIPLQAILENEFKVPVFINNDGNLFAYGEALFGILPYINTRFRENGYKRQYQNLIGITLGTGFGGGLVMNKSILTGDNGCAGNIWCLPNKKYRKYIVEESVSIRAVKRVYAELSGDKRNLTPKEIYYISESPNDDKSKYAIQAFQELGEMAGDTIATALTLIDGIIVIGGGLCGASKYILPSIIKEVNSKLGTFNNQYFNRLPQKIYNLEDSCERRSFFSENKKEIKLPNRCMTVDYHCDKKVAIALSKLGTNKAIAVGAYAFALNNLNNDGGVVNGK